MSRPCLHSADSALSDALSHLTGVPVRSEEPLGRCEILLCRNESYAVIDGILICNSCLELMSEKTISPAWLNLQGEIVQQATAEACSVQVTADLQVERQSGHP